MTLVVDVNVQDAWTEHARELALRTRREHKLQKSSSATSKKPGKVLKPSERWLGWNESRHMSEAKRYREAYHKTGSRHSAEVAALHEAAARSYASGDKAKAHVAERSITKLKMKRSGRS